MRLCSFCKNLLYMRTVSVLGLIIGSCSISFESNIIIRPKKLTTVLSPEVISRLFIVKDTPAVIIKQCFIFHLVFDYLDKIHLRKISNKQELSA